MADGEKKTKGVVDIVFLLDVTGSMKPCIDALRNNVNNFINSLTSTDVNNSNPVKDWRAKVVGYRDFDPEELRNHPSEPFVDNSFVRTPGDLAGQLAKLNAEGGGDEPESLLDAIYKVASMPQSEKGTQDVKTSEQPDKWRHRHEAARVVIIFTDASYKETMFCPEAAGGGFDDVKHVVHGNKIILSIFAPAMPCYDRLAQLDRSEFEPIEFDASDRFGPQKALASYTSDQNNFKNTMNQLAKSVAASAAQPL